MVLTVEISEALHKALEADKRRSGLSKSKVARSILLAYYAEFGKFNTDLLLQVSQKGGTKK